MMLESANMLTRLRHSSVATVRRAERIVDLNYVGLVVATGFFALSVTPSLMPRDWMFQGLISGINAAIGYGFGCLLEWGFRVWIRPRLSRVPDPPDWARYAIKSAVLVTAGLSAAYMLVQSAHWQREISALMAMEGTTTSAYLRTGGLSLVVGVLVVAGYRTLREAALFLARQLNRWLRVPRRYAPAVGFVLVLLLGLGLFNEVGMRAFFAVANSAFGVANSRTSEYALPPVLPERSGSPASLAPWDTLGFEGRWFVSHGPSAREITWATGKSAREPIRAYVGLDSMKEHRTPGGEMPTEPELAVAELRRAGAFDREVLVVVTTTGTGWVNSMAASALEYLYGGDTAIVATQYSFLPSPLSFLADRAKSAAAGRELFDAVYAELRTRPVEKRPKLLVYGESLGSQGSEAAFDGLADLRGKVDGALWVGPPNTNRLWRQFVTRRDPGSREVQPVYADGLVIRFANEAADLARPGPEWRAPRIAYLQHPSDPIVWWSPDLLFNRPDWLSEPRGAGISPRMRWAPLVTFWQVTADLTNANGVRDGFGHRYGTLVLDAWAAVLPPPDWNPELAERIRLRVRAAEAFERHVK